MWTERAGKKDLIKVGVSREQKYVNEHKQHQLQQFVLLGQALVGGAGKPDEQKDPGRGT
jgi:hypothetical protein